MAFSKNEILLDKFFKWWYKRVKKGIVSDFSTDEIAVLRIFVGWLDDLEYKEKKNNDTQTS